jgi:hypothetical protein
MSQATGQTGTTVIIDSNNSGQYGAYNISTGPWWSGNDIWNPVTQAYSSISFTAGSTTVTGFASTAGLLPGMVLYVWPDNSAGEGNTIVSVGAHSIVMSAPAPSTFSNEYVTFGMSPNTGAYEQTITNNPSTFPNGTVMTWSWPSQKNDYHVYSYPFIVYGNSLTQVTNPANMPAPLQISAITTLSTSYNVTITADTNSYDGLIETFVNTSPNPQLGNATNEVGMYFHVNADAMNYVLGFGSHLNFSQNGFNAYIVTTGGSTPDTIIMPVTTPGGTTPLQMDTGNQTVPWASLFQFLVAHGVVSGSNYVDGFQFGFEIEDGSGSATINNLSYNWNSSSGTVPAAPVIASFSPDSNIIGDGITNANILTLSGTAAANSTVNVFDGTLQLGTVIANASGAWGFTTGTLTDGTHGFTATDTNAAGTSPASSVLNVKVDTHAPTPAITNFIDNSNGTVTLSGTSEASSAVSIYDGTNTTPLGTVTTAANGTWSFTTGPLSGSHSFRAKAVDVAGNVGSSTSGVHYGSPVDNPLTTGTIGKVSSHHLNSHSHVDQLLHNLQQLASWETNDTSIIGGGDIGTLGSGWAIAGNNNFNQSGPTDQLLQNSQPLAPPLLHGTTMSIAGSSAR